MVITHTREQAQAAKQSLIEWLAPRGLAINEGKTHIVHVNDGFDFLGYNVRRYRNGKLLIKPSKDAVKRIRRRIADEVRSLQGANEAAVIKRLAPIVRGWSAYYRTAVSSETFAALDHHQWWVLWRWATRRHPNQGRMWIRHRYFGRFDSSRQDNWVFGHHASNAYLAKFGWTKIARHVMVLGGASPDNPSLAEYWAQRQRRKPPPPLSKTELALAAKQKGLCPLCRQPLIGGAEYEPDNIREWIAWFDAMRRRLHKHHFLTSSLPHFQASRGRGQHQRLHSMEEFGRGTAPPEGKDPRCNRSPEGFA